jgi:hypothetical protein
LCIGFKIAPEILSGQSPDFTKDIPDNGDKAVLKPLDSVGGAGFDDHKT